MVGSLRDVEPEVIGYEEHVEAITRGKPTEEIFGIT